MKPALVAVSVSEIKQYQCEYQKPVSVSVPVSEMKPALVAVPVIGNETVLVPVPVPVLEMKEYQYQYKYRK